MKALKIGLLAVTTLLLFTQNMMGQSPAISTKYNNQQIQKMIIDFKTNYSNRVAPPAALEQAFQRDFPGAYDIEWETAANLYEVEFEIRRDDYKAYYDQQANLIMYKRDIFENDLPAAIKNKIQAEYPTFRLSDIEEIRRGTEVIYKIEIKKGDYEINFTYNIDGTLIGKMEEY